MERLFSVRAVCNELVHSVGLVLTSNDAGVPSSTNCTTTDCR